MKIGKVAVSRVFTFDSAHRLIDYDGKCKDIHGHTYKLEVTLKGKPGDDGLVMDFNLLRDMVKRDILEEIDHKYLNDIFDFNPTCEMLGLWIWGQLEKRIANTQCSLDKIVLWETPNSFITIIGEDMK
ncbi:MAG: 6-carboxytetrahydropterin synthase QueD [Clostridium sp.]|nr:6-carboxytetrahydropterin synthase QueD [Clostridium sp.]